MQLWVGKKPMLHAITPMRQPSSILDFDTIYRYKSTPEALGG